MKINAISLNRLRNDANFQFHTEFKELAEKQTSATYNILQDLEGRYASDAATAGLGPWVAELKSLNIAFAELVRERVDEGSLKVDIVLRKARVQLDDAYYAIAERVNAFVVIEGAAAYEPFIRKLNINISKYALLAMQSSRRKKHTRNSSSPSTKGETP